MRLFFALARYEFSMFIRRPAYWIAYGLLGGFYAVTQFTPSADATQDVILLSQIWPEAGHMVFMFNIFLPLLAGILTADRMQRDFRSGVRELQSGSPLTNRTYILAKFIGALGAALLPMFLFSLVTGSTLVVLGLAPVEFLWPLFLAFLSIAVPAHAFVVAFSLACPLVIPLRVYQVLFTGYWFWGNLLSPRAFPTISDTVLNAVGQYPLQAYFAMQLDSTHTVTDAFTKPQAALNLLVLTACMIAALFAANRYLRMQNQRA